MKFFHTLLACSAPLLLADAASAQCLDQNAPTINACMAGGGQVDLAQSFKQGAGEINGAGVFLYAGIGTPEVLSIELWSALPNAGGTLLASGSGLATPGTWFDVSWPCISITPHATYYLVLGNPASICYAGDTNNGYPFGSVYANPGFGNFPNYDYTFRTYNCCGGIVQLSKTGTCPGVMRLDVAYCTPGGGVAILQGIAGSFIKSGNPCAGLVLGIANPSLVAILTANGGGNATLSFNAPAGACGRTVQAVDIASCTASNTIVL